MARLFVSIALAFLFYNVDGLIPDFLKSDYFSILRHSAVQTRNILHTPVAPENISFFLYTAENPGNAVKLDREDLTPLTKKKGNGMIVFLIHGWLSSKDNGWYNDMKDAFLTTYNDYSIVQVDWSDAANQLYYVSAINTYDVANIIADLLLDLNRDHGVNLDDILLVGHSLGGQITGFVGKLIKNKAGRKLRRIVALDPAGPLFHERPDDKRLNENDAEVVQVIHSDAGTFGFTSACGTIDFFPNGGSSQTGCKRIDLLDLRSLIEPVSCDHGRAYEYFVEAILNPNEFEATKCSSWRLFQIRKCEDVKVHLGDLTSKETGNFYFETNREKPFSKKETGSVFSKVLSILQH